MIATITKTGQITVPVKVRRKMNLTEGSQVRFIPQKEGYKVEAVKETKLSDLSGILSNNGVSLTIEDIDEAIAAAAVARDARSQDVKDGA